MNDFLTILNRAQMNFLMSSSNSAQMNFLRVQKMTLKKFLSRVEFFWTDGYFDHLEGGKIINIAYLAHNRVLLRSNIKMDHWYRSRKDRASWRDYETQLFLSSLPVRFLITSIYHLLIDFIYHMNCNFRITPSLIF